MSAFKLTWSNTNWHGTIGVVLTAKQCTTDGENKIDSVTQQNIHTGKLVSNWLACELASAGEWRMTDGKSTGQILTRTLPITTTCTTKILPSICAISLAYECFQNQFPASSTGWMYSSDVSSMWHQPASTSMPSTSMLWLAMPVHVQPHLYISGSTFVRIKHAVYFENMPVLILRKVLNPYLDKFR